MTDELSNAPEPKKTDMLALIKKYDIIVLPDSAKAEKLAALYVDEGIIPAKFMYDGLHIAVATVNNIEYVFSLNYQHINKLKTKRMTAIINEKEGYKPVTIANPMEVIEYD